MSDQPLYQAYPYQAATNLQLPDPQLTVAVPVVEPEKTVNTNLLIGVVDGAAVAYLLTNKKFKKGVASTGEQAWSAVRGEVEELKERLEDTQAELEYYRKLHKED